METTVRLLAGVAPRVFEIVCAELTIPCILTTFTLLNLMVANAAARRIASDTTIASLPYKVHYLMILWATSCISILVWAMCLILLHAYEVY
jgi:hypothetical protein